MAANQKKHTEPLLHMAKRDNLPAWKAWTIRIGAILIGFLICGILSSLLTGVTVTESYQIMFKGVFGKLLEYTRKAVPVQQITHILLSPFPFGRPDGRPDVSISILSLGPF